MGHDGGAAGRDGVAELEITLERGKGTDLNAHFVLRLPDGETDLRHEARDLKLDLEELRSVEHVPLEYGRKLQAMLLGGERAQTLLIKGRQATKLRIRLVLSESVADLQALHWERLTDPSAEDRHLLRAPNILFSRYLASDDRRPYFRRRREELKALVAIASPHDLAARGFAPISVARELERARNGLGAIQVDVLPRCVGEGGTSRKARATEGEVLDALRAQDYDVLYLVCHGTIHSSVAPEPTLILEDEDGITAEVSGEHLVKRLGELTHLPRLVVLASCESAGAGAAPAMMALGPQLALAGVPAVLAMNGSVAMKTVERFMPRFFESLSQDGLVDQAVAEGRKRIEDPGEDWKPVLFMRLVTGRMWYGAGFQRSEGAVSSWEEIWNNIYRGRAAVVLGQGMLNSLFGPGFDLGSWIARRWADRSDFPLSPHQRDDLTAAAQYLARRSAAYPHDRFVTELIGEIERRLGRPESVRGGPQELDDLLAELLEQQSARGVNLYRMLAELPFPVYITTCPDNLLCHTIEATRLRVGQDKGESRTPRRAALRWKKGIAPLPEEPRRGRSRGSSADPKNPVVYHLFGTLADTRSLVLTQDDYFDFLVNSRSKDVLDDRDPGPLAKLQSGSVIFLGFHFDSWEFRTVQHMLIGRESNPNWEEPHIAAQIVPDDDRVLDPVATRIYLRELYMKLNMSLYLGTVEDFLTDLQRHEPKA